ncbi:MAG: two-CW domain-containing protein [Candidatus Hodarchaeales archaeon]
MSSLNCWDFKNCGKTDSCPAATFVKADGFAGGQNGGRACVYITGTYCSGTIQGTFKDKERGCDACEFYQLLRQEHPAEMSHSNFLKYVKARA